MQRLFRKEVLSAYCGREAPDSVILIVISNGKEIVHSPMKIGGKCNRRVAGSSPARGVLRQAQHSCIAESVEAY